MEARIFRAFICAALAVPLLVTAQAQSVIVGRVVADGSGDPISHARVSIDYPNNTDRLVALSDKDGRFALPVPPGRHDIVAYKPRFGRGQMRVDAGTGAGDIRLRRTAAISGRIIDVFGDPVIAARVFVERSAGVVVANTGTDDRGEYRIGALPAGTYAVSVLTIGRPMIESLGGDRFYSGPLQTKTYYTDGRSFAEAQSIELTWGDERAGVDLVLPAARAGLQPFDTRRGAGESFGQFGRNGKPAAAATRTAPPTTRTPPSAGVIRGLVSGVNNLPLPDVIVRLESGDQLVRTAGDGRFEFSGLLAGIHRVSASRVGYFGREVHVPLKQNERVERPLQLEGWGTVAGRVFDQYGDPVQRARIEALHVRYEAGRRGLVAAQSLGSETDDQGTYRLFGLRTGQYVISAEANGVFSTVDLPAYVRTFFPGTAQPPQAQFVTVGQVAEVTGIDFGVVRALTVTVSGRFLNPKDEPTGGSLQLMPSQTSLSAVRASVGARLYGDGHFEFFNVPPGEYVVQGYRGRTNSWTEGEFGAARVTVADSDVRGLVVRTSAGSSIRGRIVFEASNGSKLPTASEVVLSPIPADYDLSPQNNFASANIRPDGSFAIEGINGPRRLEVLKAPPGWVLREIRSSGINITDRVLPFGTAHDSVRDVEVVLTDRVSELTGSVRDDRSRPIASATIVVFSTDRSLWYPQSRHIQRQRSEADGRFSMSGLPAGQYYAASVRNVPADGDEAWQEPSFLESLIPGAQNVLVSEGTRASTSFRLSDR